MTAATTAPPPWQDTVAQEGSRLLDAMREVTPQITEAVIKYVWATGVTGVVLSLLLFIISIVGYALAWNFFRIEQRRKTEEGGWAALGVITGLASTLVYVPTILIFKDALPKVLAPEGAAVMMALNALGGSQ